MSATSSIASVSAIWSVPFCNVSDVTRVLLLMPVTAEASRLFSMSLSVPKDANVLEVAAPSLRDWRVAEGTLELPRLLDTVRTLAQTVEVDYFVPGCPPSAEAIWTFLEELLAGRPVEFTYSQVHFD